MQSVADPGNVEEALNSVGDAVENAVPDPKDAPTGLAPTSAVSNSLATDEKAEGVLHYCRVLPSMFCKAGCVCKRTHGKVVGMGTG